jgi:hypothetical protein
MLNSNRPMTARTTPDQFPDESEPNGDGYEPEPNNEEAPEELYPGDGIFPNNELELGALTSGVAILIVGLLFSLAGCNSSEATGGSNAGVGDAWASRPTCETGDDACGIPVVAPQSGNPCMDLAACTAYVTPSLRTCGWDVQDNLCWAEPWCEPSVISTDQFLYRPASAVCPPGTASYTYEPGTMMVWGPADSGSVQGPTSAVTGYVCVPNTAPVTIQC